MVRARAHATVTSGTLYTWAAVHEHYVVKLGMHFQLHVLQDAEITGTYIDQRSCDVCPNDRIIVDMNGAKCMHE